MYKKKRRGTICYKLPIRERDSNLCTASSNLLLLSVQVRAKESWCRVPAVPLSARDDPISQERDTAGKSQVSEKRVPIGLRLSVRIFVALRVFSARLRALRCEV